MKAESCTPHTSGVCLGGISRVASCNGAHATGKAVTLDPCGVTAFHLLSQVVDGLANPVVIIDSGGRVCLANIELCRLSGYSRRALDGLTFAECLEPGCRDAWRQFVLSMERSLDGDGRHHAVDLTLQSNDGYGVLMTASASWLEIEGQRFMQVSMNSASTEEKWTPERQMLLDEIIRLRFSRQQLVDTLPALVIALDPEGNIVDLNHAFLERIGRPREELLGTPCSSILRHEFCESGCVHLSASANGIPHTCEVNSESLCGTFLINSNPRMTPDGRFLGTTLVALDVTEQVQTQRQLEQAQKMECVGRMAGGVAHDFKNHLTGILVSVATLKDRLQGGASEHIVNLADIIEKSAQHCSHIAQQLLAYSRTHSADSEPVCAKQMIQETVRLLHGALGPRIQIQTDLDAADTVVMANATQLQQVLLNLAINARDAMNGGGTLSFRLSNPAPGQVAAARRIQGEYESLLSIEVADTGCGISAEHLSQIFEPFFTTKPADTGTGLGLSMVYNIVRDNGGVIDVDSAVGVGTTFRILLPAGARCETETPEESDHLTGGSETILVVDDEEVLCELASTILEDFGYTVLAATTGEEGIELYREHRDKIGLVILDLLLPGISGKEIYERLRRDTPDLRAIVTSGCFTGSAEDKALLAADVATVQKPYTVSQLVRKVREVLDAPAQAGASS